jgi:hypothetical protein
MNMTDKMIVVGVIFIVAIALWYFFTHAPPSFAYKV